MDNKEINETKTNENRIKWKLITPTKSSNPNTFLLCGKLFELEFFGVGFY